MQFTIVDSIPIHVDCCWHITNTCVLCVCVFLFCLWFVRVAYLQIDIVDALFYDIGKDHEVRDNLIATFLYAK